MKYSLIVFNIGTLFRKRKSFDKSCSANWLVIIQTFCEPSRAIYLSYSAGVTRALLWEAQEAGRRATCRAAKTTAYLRARPNAQTPSFRTRIQVTFPFIIVHLTKTCSCPCWPAQNICWSNIFDNIINYSRGRWGRDVLLQKALRGKADDRVLLVQHLGAPHLRQGQAHRHPRHLVLRPLQDEKYKRRSKSSGASKSAEESTSRNPQAAASKYQEEVIIKKTNYL